MTFSQRKKKRIKNDATWENEMLQNQNDFEIWKKFNAIFRADK